MTDHDLMALMALASAGVVFLLFIGVLILWDAYN
jgi:hypothetical protein